MKRIINIIALLFVVAGLIILTEPFFRYNDRVKTSSQAVEEFKKLADQLEADNSYVEESSGNESHSSDHDSSVAEKSSDDNYDELYKSLVSYNLEQYSNGQSELRDAFSYMTSSIDFTDFGLPDDVAGYITIDKMGVELPLYIGLNQANMANGATIMDHTSMPVGGINTNCVIAAHRMAGFFGDIELLSVGDIVKVTNLWGELRYRVEKIIVIDPYDTDKIKIIPGHDMITLLTCHPYWSNKTRYIVYCERTGIGAFGETALTSEVSGQPAQTSSVTQEQSSVEEKTENDFLP